MNASAKSQFLATPVIISSLATALVMSITSSPTADFSTWAQLTGATIIPMGFILAYIVHVVRRQQVEYALHRAIGMGMTVGLISVSLTKLTIRHIIPEIF
jgi:hypothetical protein